jgi:ABC-type multidrug transport system permease subunit
VYTFVNSPNVYNIHISAKKGREEELNFGIIIIIIILEIIDYFILFCALIIYRRQKITFYKKNRAVHIHVY